MAVLAGEHPAAQRRPGQQPEPERGAAPAPPRARCPRSQQRVLHLGGDQRAPGRAGHCQRRGPGGLPAGVVRHADVARPAADATASSSAERVSSSGVRVAPRVHLPQVDVVGAEPAQRGVERREQVPPRGVDHPLAGAPGDAGLGGDHDLVAGDQRRRAARRSPPRTRRRRRRRRCRPGCRRRRGTPAAGRGRLVLVGVAAPGHRAEREPGDRAARIGRAALLHGACDATEHRAPDGLDGRARTPLGPLAMATRAEPRLLGRRQRRRQPGAGPGGRPARLRRASGRRRPTAPTRRPCWPGSPRRPSGSTSARRSCRSPARTPAMTAMTAATLDTLSGGRFRLGLGVSGPAGLRGLARRPVRQAAGPHPRVRRHRPAWRCARETVALRRRALDPAAARRPRQGAAADRAPGPRATSRSTSPRSARRTWSWPARSPTAGWPSSSPPSTPTEQLASRARPAGRKAGQAAGRLRRRADRARSWSATTSRPAPTPVRRYAALYVGGMGSREQNFYNQLAVRMGYGEAAAEVQDLYLARRHRDAAAAVPFEFIDRTSLLGPQERIAERMHALRRGRRHHAVGRPVRRRPRAAPADAAHHGRAARRDWPGRLADE